MSSSRRLNTNIVAEIDTFLNTIDDLLDEKQPQSQQVHQTAPSTESLTLTNSNGKYSYNRYGYTKYDQLCKCLMKQYDLTVDEDDNKLDSNLSYGRKCELATSGINAISTLFHSIILKHRSDDTVETGTQQQPSIKNINFIYSNELYCDTPRLIKYLRNTFYTANNSNLSINLHEFDITNSTTSVLDIFSNKCANQTNILFF